MDAPSLLGLGFRLIIDSVAKKVENSSQCFFADGNSDTRTRVDGFHTARHTVGGGHGDTSDHVITKLCGHLAHHLPAFVHDLYGRKKVRQVSALKFYVKYRPDDLYDTSNVFFHSKAPLYLFLCTRNDFGNFLCDDRLTRTVKLKH